MHASSSQAVQRIPKKPLGAMGPFEEPRARCGGSFGATPFPQEGLTRSRSMEKRILIAAAISAVFMTWYAQSVLRWADRAPLRPADGAAQRLKTAPPTAQVATPAPPEERIVLESPAIQLEIGKTSAAIRSVVLKRFFDTASQRLLKIQSDFPLLHVRINEQTLNWDPTQQLPSSAVFEAVDNSGNSYYISYSIDNDNSNVSIMLAQSSHSDLAKRYDVTFISTWTKADQLSDRYNSLQLVAMLRDADGKQKYATYNAPFKHEKNVPRGTTILSLSERYFCQAIQYADGGGTVTLLPSAPGTIAARIALPTTAGDQEQRLATVYFGPRDYFYLRKVGFQGAFPIGMLGQLGLMLLSLLNGIAKLVHNYGVAVIVFSVLVTCAMAPFTMISFRSMKKLQDLKPQMDKIMARHKDNPKQANQEIFALYRQHRVSPLSGCLPMLLQLPIFFALFQAISHYVELRGKGFLWIADLSLPDRIATLPFSIPFLGNEINLLPILMAFAMFIQQRASQKNVPSGGTTPAMNLMSGPLMAVLFGVMFYQFPAGLVLYWLTNSLISLGWYRLAK